MKTPGRKNLVLIMLLPWLMAAVSLLGAEARSLIAIPALFKKDVSQRNYLSAGPLYELYEKAVSGLSPGARLFFVNPSVDPASMYYSYRLKYYLYPARLIEHKTIDALPRDISANDMLMVFVSGNAIGREGKGIVHGLKDRFVVEDYYLRDNPGSFQAIFRVRGLRDAL